jgi:hypothetical protein
MIELCSDLGGSIGYPKSALVDSVPCPNPDALPVLSTDLYGL